jgi:hypothetical protein
MKDLPLGTQHAQSESAEYALQVRKILDSATFQESPLLRLFLEFVTNEALNGSVDSISEYAIATRVLGRGHDFDPSSAAVVRTQAYRLRRKLAEYYAKEGAADSILVELPKGHYYPAFSRRKPSVVAALPAGRLSRFSWVTAALVLTGFVLGVLLGAVAFNYAREAARPATSSPHLAQLWGDIAQEGRSVVVAFTNPTYFVSNSGDLFRSPRFAQGSRGEPVPREFLSPGHAHLGGALFYEDGFTGTGEVFAMHRLSRLLERSGVSVIVKRNTTVTVEDLRSHDVVFVGAGIRVQALQNKKLLKRFEIRPAPADAGPWMVSILDHAAAPGEASSYAVQRDPSTRILNGDYAVFAALPGVIPSRRIFLLAGLTTSGTQGAAEYATSEHHLEQLAAALSPKDTASPALPRFFEAVLRIDVAKGIDPVQTTLVAGAPIPVSQ